MKTLARLRILWRLRRDVDADLARYRGWSLRDLKAEYFRLRIMKLLREDAVRRALTSLGIASKEATVSMLAWSAAVAAARRDPMNDAESDGAP